MKTAYFFSSRTCSEKKQYKDYLLCLQNMAEDGEISLDKTDYLSQIRTFANNDVEMDKVKDPDILILLIKSKNSSDEELNKLIEENFDGLKNAGIINPDETSFQSFKTVYRMNSSTADWMLFAVPEICGTDPKKNVVEAQKRWCDLLIQYILKKEEASGLDSIHLFLHDKDIPGYGNLTQQLIDGVGSCKAEGLINDDTVKDIGNKNLTIVFFKHTSTSCVMDIIGPSDKNLEERRRDLPKAFETAFNILRGVGEFRQFANELKTKLDQE